MYSFQTTSNFIRNWLQNTNVIHAYRHENSNVSLDALCYIEQLKEINDYYCILYYPMYAIKNVQYTNWERGNVDNGYINEIALNDENPKGYAIC